MSKLTIAFLSFIVGGVSSFMFFASFGSRASTVVQDVVIEGAVPIVPPLRAGGTSGSDFRGTFALDGINSAGDTFNNATVKYGGGAFRLIQPKFSGGPIRLELVGAAANTLYLIQFLQAVEAGRHPNPAIPRKPLQKTAEIKQAVITTDLISPYGQ